MKLFVFSSRLALIGALWPCCLAPVAAQSGGNPLEGVITKEGIARIRVAVPEASAGAGVNEIAREITETLRDDLGFSGYFDVVDPRLYELVRPPEDDQPRHADWLSIGAEALVQTRISASADGRIGAEVRLFQNDGASLLFARRYGGTTDLVRRVAHQIADDIVRQRTGQCGIALTRVAFVATHGSGKEIYLIDYDGRRARRLTSTGTLNLSPVWSPDGDELAYVSWRGRQPGVYAMSNTGERRHLATIGGELSSAPAWSHDGNRLVYSSDYPGNTEIYLLDRTTGRNTRLTHDPAIDTSPVFSPNGREVAFTSDRAGSPQIYVMDAEGTNVRRLSWSGSYNESPAWSPDGERLAYVTRREGRFDVVIQELGSGEGRRITFGEGNSEDPAWSPDGRFLVFSSDRNGSYDLYTMTAEGRDVRRLTRSGNSYTPHWSPHPDCR